MRLALDELDVVCPGMVLRWSDTAVIYAEGQNRWQAHFSRLREQVCGS